MATLTRRITIRLHHTDAAGILFFANQFVIAHDLYEDFLAEIGLPINKVLHQESFHLPIVHADSQFRRTLVAGDVVDVRLSVADIGNTSFTLAYELTTPSMESVGQAKTVHVAVEKATMKKIHLPQKLHDALLQFRNSA